MRNYDIIPLPELRRQYKREKELRDAILSSIIMILCDLLFVSIYLFY